MLIPGSFYIINPESDQQFLIPGEVYVNSLDAPAGTDAVGTSSGTSTAVAFSGNFQDADGSSTGTSTAEAFAANIQDSVGNAAGVATVLGSSVSIPTIGILIEQAKDIEVYGNTIVRTNIEDGLEDYSLSLTIGMSASSGSHTVMNNVFESRIVSGSQTDVVNNVVLGINGQTIDYADAFDGPTFNPTSRTDVLTLFNMKANGPLDADNSGGPSVGDIGAIGSGYVTWPDFNPGTENAAIDTGYE